MPFGDASCASSIEHRPPTVLPDADAERCTAPSAPSAAAGSATTNTCGARGTATSVLDSISICDGSSSAESGLLTPASNTGVCRARRLVSLPPRVDTLYLSFLATSSDRTRKAEKVEKRRVQGPPLSAEHETDRWSFKAGEVDGNTGYDFMALGHGKMAGVNVFWGPPPTGSSLPRLRRFKIAIGSEVLWRHYANGGTAHSCALEILELLERDLVERLPSHRTVRVRRVDVCIDHWGYTWSGVDLTRFVCRQTSRGLEERSGRQKRRTQLEDVGREAAIVDVNTVYGKNSATYYIGARGSSSVMLRVYNKIAEAQHSGKLPWMEPAWKAAGWDGETTVWRAEIEIGGDWLSAHGFDTLDKLEGCERALWRHYTSKVRHITPNRSRRKRSATSRVWMCLRGSIRRAERQAKKDQLGKPAWTWQPRPPRVDGDMETLSAMLGGCGRKIGAQLFRPANHTPLERAAKRAELLAFIGQVIDRAEIRAAKRSDRRARPPPEPPPAPPEPKPRRVSQLVAAMTLRGDQLAAEFERAESARQAAKRRKVN